ncbi:MAG: chorismate synthase [Bacilli bacterium]|nr:chorismate synthase [Bacilli bacterium]
MRYVSSGHSHGNQITVVLEGVPSNVPIDIAKINEALKLRRSGYGRGSRMNIETDQVEITGGILYGKTTGAPITIIIKNNDYINHESYMDPFNFSKQDKITVPRPGHADLVGMIKYQFDDTRPVFERASARETVSRVVVGSIAEQVLAFLDISSRSFVTQIGNVKLDDYELDWDYLDESPVFMPSRDATKRACELIDYAKTNQDTLGGVCQVEVMNVPLGLGSFVSHETKLDAKIAQSLISIQACKGVEFGDGFKLADNFGSVSHDEIYYDQGFKRKTNHAGGFEGGMTTGEPIIVRAVFKPIPTLMKPLMSVDIKTKESVPSHIERSDVCIVPSASVICKYTVLFEILNALVTQFTADTLDQLIKAVKEYRDYVARF